VNVAKQTYSKVPHCVALLKRRREDVVLQMRQWGTEIWGTGGHCADVAKEASLKLLCIEVPNHADLHVAWKRKIYVIQTTIWKILA